jgi:hypothetical protein
VRQATPGSTGADGNGPARRKTRYRLLRWRAAPAARPAGARAGAIPGALSQMNQTLSWLAGKPRLTAGVVHPLLAHPASSVSIMRARAFKAWLVISRLN